MELSATLATDLAKLRANIAALEKEEKELTKKLKGIMQAEHNRSWEYSPRQSPYKLCLDKTFRSSVSWKDEWKALCKKFNINWKKREDQLKEESVETVWVLRVEPNENYKVA